MAGNSGESSTKPTTTETTTPDPKTIPANVSNGKDKSATAKTAQTKTGTQAEMQAKHKDENPVKATATGTTVTYEYANGDKFTIKGNHPDRDQNPGNVIAGDFATDHGAIGKDKGFAIFPTAANGWSAMKDTIAVTYASKSVNEMIAICAPPLKDGKPENNTPKYQATATKLAGVSGGAKISTLSNQQIITLMNVMAIKVEGWHGAPYAEK